MFIMCFIHLTNLDIYKIIHVNTLRLLHKLVAVAVVICMVKQTHSAQKGTGLGRSRGGTEPWLCLQLVGDPPMGSAPLGYCGGHFWSVLATSGLLNYYHRNLL